jgi:hypothetical protein
MREITEAQRSGPAARNRKKPVSDALSVTFSRITGSQAVIHQSRARIEAAAAQLAARSAEIDVVVWTEALRGAAAVGGGAAAGGDEAPPLRRAG